jgi:hypothetical protein
MGSRRFFDLETPDLFQNEATWGWNCWLATGWLQERRDFSEF